MAFWKKTDQAAEPENAVVLDEQIEAMIAERKPEPMRRRSEVLKLRLTPDELQYLTEQANTAGMSRTDYIMAASKGLPVIVIDDIPKLLHELRRQGSNLNQLTRLAHQTHSTDIQALRDAINKCSIVQADILRLIDQWNIRIRNETEKREG